MPAARISCAFATSSTVPLSLPVSTGSSLAHTPGGSYDHSPFDYNTSLEFVTPAFPELDEEKKDRDWCSGRLSAYAMPSRCPFLLFVFLSSVSTIILSSFPSYVSVPCLLLLAVSHKNRRLPETGV